MPSCGRWGFKTVLFNSATYILLFLPVVTALYWYLPKRPRMWLILIASLVFYGFWRIDFIPLVLFSAMLDYYLAIAIDKIEEPRARRRLLLISVFANLLILGFFKYLVFFAHSAGSIGPGQVIYCALQCHFLSPQPGRGGQMARGFTLHV